MLVYGNDSGEVVTPTPDKDNFDDDQYDQYLDSEVLLPISGENKTGKVVHRKRDANGHSIWRPHQKVACDTREYIVEFPDGAEAAFSANIITENMYANGNTYWQATIVKEIKAIRITFKILHGDEQIPSVHQQIRCHLIFGMKMEDLRRKARYVA